MKFLGMEFGGSSKEEKKGDGARHIAIPSGEGAEFSAEDQDSVNMAAQLYRLDEQLKRAQEDANAGRNPEIPIAELEEKIANIRAQMPYGEENEQ